MQILLDMPVTGGGSRKRSHKARGITEQGADRQFFDRFLNGESRPMSVAEYYATGVRLQVGPGAALPSSMGFAAALRTSTGRAAGEVWCCLAKLQVLRSIGRRLGLGVHHARSGQPVDQAVLAVAWQQAFKTGPCSPVGLLQQL